MMVIAESFKIEIEKEIQLYTKKPLKIKKALPVHGGDIHSSFQLLTEEKPFFLKTSRAVPQDLFRKEFNGLQLLQKQKAISIAHPINFGSVEGHDYLLMEYIDRTATKNNFWDLLAKGVADLHKCTQDTFGLHEDNYIGTLYQSNKPKDNWAEFYTSERLQPLIQKCIDQELLGINYMDKAMHLYKRLPDIFPMEAPALLHGDLWGGNYLCGLSGEPYLFDPAVYYGHREIDLAMTRLFGGFDRQFYWHYDEYFPLTEGWQKRITLCQLYPLLVHSLLFGGGYVQRVRRILEEYG